MFLCNCYADTDRVIEGKNTGKQKPAQDLPKRVFIINYDTLRFS